MADKECTCKLKVSAIHSFFEDENTDCSEEVKEYWLGLSTSAIVKVHIKNYDLSVSETISNTGTRAYEMLEEGEVEGYLHCQNVFQDWEEDEQIVSFEMIDIS